MWGATISLIVSYRERKTRSSLLLFSIKSEKIVLKYFLFISNYFFLFKKVITLYFFIEKIKCAIRFRFWLFIEPTHTSFNGKFNAFWRMIVVRYIGLFHAHVALVSRWGNSTVWGTGPIPGWVHASCTLTVGVVLGLILIASTRRRLPGSQK